jgi:hypothetical protein
MAAPLVLSGDYSYEGGLAAAHCLAKTHPRPEAVVCANDLGALGLLDGLRRAGLCSPRDVLVMGYDNIGMAAWEAYQLSSFDQDVPEIIRRALRAHPRSLDSVSMSCGEATQHDPDHGEADKGASFAGMPLVVACQATVTADPCQRALNDPALWQHDEAAQVGRFDDLQLPGPVHATKACIFAP